MSNYSASELYHHGILGQKWGVRRFQNKDGTLTSKGKKRYSDSDGKFSETEKRLTAKAGVLAGVGAFAYGKAKKADRVLSLTSGAYDKHVWDATKGQMLFKKGADYPYSGIYNNLLKKTHAEGYDAATKWFDRDYNESFRMLKNSDDLRSAMQNRWKLNDINPIESLSEFRRAKELVGARQGATEVERVARSIATGEHAAMTAVAAIGAIGLTAAGIGAYKAIKNRKAKKEEESESGSERKKRKTSK